MKTKQFFYAFLVMIIFLFSCNKENENQKAKWIENAFNTFESENYPQIKAISWWNEDFDNSYLTVNSSNESLQAYKNGVSSSTFITMPNFSGNILLEPSSGIYHSANPGFIGAEDYVTEEIITDFETLVGKNIVWAYFSNNWRDNIQFPTSNVNIIHEAGKVPFIRMMPRTDFDEGEPDPNYTMQKIIDGVFDTQLTQWAIDAKNTNIPLLVEFGTEVNGNWFPWNGQYNGGGTTDGYGDPNSPDGPERFKDAYRHIIDICNNNGANNITWFFHVDDYSLPEEDWNNFENYYPGDEYIDWIGISIYGAFDKHEDYYEFSYLLDEVYPRLTILTNKPIAILEFAITEMD